MNDLLNLIEGKKIEIRKDVTYYLEKYGITVTSYFGSIMFYCIELIEDKKIERVYICNNQDSLINQFYLFVAGILPEKQNQKK